MAAFNNEARARHPRGERHISGLGPKGEKVPTSSFYDVAAAIRLIRQRATEWPDVREFLQIYYQKRA